MERPAAAAVAVAVAVAVLCSISLLFSTVRPNDHFTGFSNIGCRQPSVDGLCSNLIEPSGYPCFEHTAQTEDGYLLGLQRVSSHAAISSGRRGPPVLLLHGLMMVTGLRYQARRFVSEEMTLIKGNISYDVIDAGDAWFMNTESQSLGFILADHGFDVWVGNVRGTHWSHGHVSLSLKDKEFWDWSWQDLALYDLSGMLRYVNNTTNSKVLVVGHSQGTIMSLAAFTQPDIVELVEAAALLCPISYLDHITASFVLRLVHMHLDEVILALGIHQLNFRSDALVNVLDLICDELDCNDLLTSVTGKNCCFNNSRVEFYLQYEPHPTSSKNLNHLFQMIRKGTFAMYDYGKWKNLKQYGQLKPPKFDLSYVPSSLPLWIAYGGNDALADVTDVQHTINELQSEPESLYLENYGHIDFLLSVTANRDVYDNMIRFFRSLGKFSSS